MIVLSVILLSHIVTFTLMMDTDTSPPFIVDMCKMTFIVRVGCIKVILLSLTRYSSLLWVQAASMSVILLSWTQLKIY